MKAWLARLIKPLVEEAMKDTVAQVEATREQLDAIVMAPDFIFGGTTHARDH